MAFRPNGKHQCANLQMALLLSSRISLPFTLADILLMVGLALAAGFFIFVFVNPPEALINWITGKSKASPAVKPPAKGPDKR